MKPGRFSYEAPRTIEAALASLAWRGDDAKLIAGGQSLAPLLNMRLARPEHLIDINGVSELGTIRLDGGRLSIGAMVRHAALGKSELVHRHCPMLAHAAETIGHYAIRQRGTIGGSLAHADPAAQLPLAALALDAEIEIWSAAGKRTVPARAFFVSIFTTVVRPDELIVAVHVPLTGPQDGRALAYGNIGDGEEPAYPPLEGQGKQEMRQSPNFTCNRPARDGWGFRLFNRRAGDFAIVSVAATLRRGDDGTIKDLRLAIGGIGPIPVRVETLVTGGIAGRISKDWSTTIAATIAGAVEIEDNERTPVNFRRELVAALTEDALDQALENAR
jgi:carbon-monoxide dehydrogenase medium subunit